MPSQSTYNSNLFSNQISLEYSHIFSPDSTGKEKDSETGYYYFGARYYNPDLSLWLSVDPMADKYPSLSPYNYCAWNPMKLNDPDGMEMETITDWYKNKKGEMTWSTEHKKSMNVNGEKYENVGRTYSDKSSNTYYSLFGQRVGEDSPNGKITKQLDEAFINYANYCEQNKDYQWSIFNPEGPRRYSTDFGDILNFKRGKGTTTANMHYPNEMGSYAGLADIYFYVTGSRNSMQGTFFSWDLKTMISGGDGHFSTPRGIYLTIGQSASPNNTFIGLNFKTNAAIEKFQKTFWKLFPNATP